MNYVFEYLNRYYILVVVAVLMIFASVFTTRKKSKDKGTILAFFILMILLSVAQYVDNKCGEHANLRTLRYCCSIFAYCGRPFILILLLWIVDERWKKTWTVMLPAIINAGFYLSSPFTHLCFWFTQENIFVRGPLGYMEICTSIVYGIFFIVITFLRFRNGRAVENALLTIVVFFSMIAAAMEMFSVDKIFYLPTLGVGLIIFYLYIHIQHNRERELENQLKYQEANTALMVSQIQPHFIYNTLASIRYLAKTDSEKAVETIEEFSSYLRSNVNSIRTNAPIPFEEELAHVQTYVHIEQLRFPNITVEYNIEDRNYDLPSLTLQPMVENAIKHGVRGVENGRVVIHSYKEKNVHYIEIVSVS